MEYIQDYGTLYKTIGITVVIFVLFYYSLYSYAQKIIYTSFSIFYFLYNGFGISFTKGVHNNFFKTYIILYIALSISYYLFGKLILSEFAFFRASVKPFLERFNKSKILVYTVIILYFALSLFPLLYPEVKVMRLLAPPPPNLKEQFIRRIETVLSGRKDPFIKIIENISYLLFPFYLITLSYFRRQPIKLFLFLFIPLYFHYCAISYINRGLVLETLLIFGATLWFYVPKYRKYLYAVFFVILPLMPIVLLNYTKIREGGKAQEISSTDAALTIVQMEAIMPTFSKKIFNTKKRLNLKHYFLWMVTLPVPKVITGPVPRAYAGAEMSEILLGKKMGEKGYYALLSGLVNESVYTYGTRWFFLHGIMIGLIMAIAARMTEFNVYLFPILLIFAILFSYTLNRGGIASTLPQFINKFLSLYLVLGAHYLKKRFKSN